MKNFFLTIVFLLGLSNCLFSQIIPKTAVSDSTTLYEKLYLHIDRELYQPGDDVWFKSYLVSGINQQLIPGFKNIYVQLIAEDGHVVDELLTLSIRGVSNNDFQLPDTLSTGSYTIRGYTKYLQNFGEESLFHQKIAVASPGTTNLTVFENDTEKPATIDISFLPEGGSFVLNAANYIAFKAIDEKGRGVSVSGKVVDETGEEIVSFESLYKGMGTFMMMPKEGKKYTAKIDGYPGFSYEFEAPQFDGIAMHFQPKGNELYFILSRNMKSGNLRNLVWSASHKGKELFRKEIEMSGFQYPLKIFKGLFPLGISKITITDERENVLSERLIFVQSSGDESIRITTGKDAYETRDSIELELETLLEGDSIETGISLAVVSEDYFSENGRSQSMKSYLLLDSELKGPLESPADCFFDSETITSDEKLDLVMQVHGWRRYYWDELDNYFGKPLPGWEDIGLTIDGRIKRLFRDKWVKGGVVKLGPFSSQFIILRDTTDKEGRFRFDRVYVRDSATMMLNAYNERGKRNVEIIHDPQPIFDSIASVAEINRAAREIEIPDRFYRVSYYRYLAEREFNLEEGTILLGDVEVVAEELKSPPIITGFYGFPDREYKFTEEDRWRYYNFLDYLNAEIPGVYSDGDIVRVNNAVEDPVFFVDGIAYGLEEIRYMTMDDIGKVEIFNPKGYLSMFRTAGNGIISILTKTGFGSFRDEWKRIIHGRITPRMRGFRQSHEFYSPAYPLENDSLNRPDQRATLFWEPFVMPQNGKVKVKFHASDMLYRYRIIAEGISRKGKLCFGTAAFDVVVPEEE